MADAGSFRWRRDKGDWVPIGTTVDGATVSMPMPGDPNDNPFGSILADQPRDTRVAATTNPLDDPSRWVSCDEIQRMPPRTPTITLPFTCVLPPNAADPPTSPRISMPVAEYEALLAAANWMPGDTARRPDPRDAQIADLKRQNAEHVLARANLQDQIDYLLAQFDRLEAIKREQSQQIRALSDRAIEDARANPRDEECMRLLTENDRLECLVMDMKVTILTLTNTYVEKLRGMP